MHTLKRGITIFLILTLMLSCISIIPVYATETNDTTIPEMPVDDIELNTIPTSEPADTKVPSDGDKHTIMKRR